MSQVRVERQKGYYGMVRTLDIVADGNVVGNLQQGQVATFEVPEYSQQIWGKMDWGETLRIELKDYDPSKTIVFKGYFTLNLLKNLGATKMPFKVFIRDEPSA